MKTKIISTFVLIALVLLFSFPAYAEDTVEYVLDEPGISISLPSGYFVFTRDFIDSGLGLNERGWTEESLHEYMSSVDLYLIAWDENTNPF